MDLKHISKGQRDNQKDRAEVDGDTSQNGRSKDIEQKRQESGKPAEPYISKGRIKGDR